MGFHLAKRGNTVCVSSTGNFRVIPIEFRLGRRRLHLEGSPFHILQPRTCYISYILAVINRTPANGDTDLVRLQNLWSKYPVRDSASNFFFNQLPALWGLKVEWQWLVYAPLKQATKENKKHRQNSSVHFPPSINEQKTATRKCNTRFCPCCLLPSPMLF